MSALDKRAPRVLMLSARKYKAHAVYCMFYEFEDLISGWTGADVYLPEHSFNLPRKAYTLANRVTRSPRVSRFITPRFDSRVLDQEYDLFFIICNDIFELISITSVKNFRQKCGKAVCYIAECWPSWLESRKFLLEPLRQFDHVFLATRSSAEMISGIIDRPCSYLPFGVDALAFCPFPSPPPRGVDVWNLGRRSPITHEALLKLAKRENLHYYFDTTGYAAISDLKNHRWLISSLIKRCRYFIANHAKVDEPAVTRGAKEISGRFFEAAAGGAVLLGAPPAQDLMDAHLNWPDAVIPIPFHAPDIANTIAELDSQPERLARISRENVVNSLLRHDWVYRWRQVLDTVGLYATPEMALRETALRNLAEQVRHSEFIKLTESDSGSPTSDRRFTSSW